MDLVQLALNYSAAWASRNLDAIADFHTEDSVFCVHADLAAATGRPAVRDFIAAIFGACPDLSFASHRFFAGTDHLVSQFEMSGTVQGAPFVCDGVDVITTRDGRIATKDTYLDLAAYERQVGAPAASLLSG
jgi:ketosteroid isomerase-like protein